METEDTQQWRSRPVPWLGIAAVAVWLSFCVAHVLDGVDGLIWFLPSAAWGLFWFLRLLISDARKRSVVNPVQVTKRAAILYWGFEPAVYVLSVLLFVGADLRFHFSRPALEAYAADVRSGNVAPITGEFLKVGSYEITGVERFKGGAVWLETTGGWVNIQVGFASLPGEPSFDLDAYSSRDTYEHIVGPWYHWRRH